jgi:hypothetical protein
MASERVLEVMVRRHVFDTGGPFAGVLDGIFGGISQPDIARLLSKLAASGTYQEFSFLVEQAQGGAGLMRFLQLDLDNALSLDPEAGDWTGRRLVRLIAGNPVTMGQMTCHVPDAGSYAPVTILIEEVPEEEPAWPTTRSPARSLPMTMQPRPRSPGGSTPRCSGSCARQPVSRHRQHPRTRRLAWPPRNETGSGTPGTTATRPTMRRTRSGTARPGSRTRPPSAASCALTVPPCPVRAAHCARHPWVASHVRSKRTLHRAATNGMSMVWRRAACSWIQALASVVQLAASPASWARPRLCGPWANTCTAWGTPLVASARARR